jgi:hypothetical protein
MRSVTRWLVITFLAIAFVVFPSPGLSKQGQVQLNPQQAGQKRVRVTGTVVNSATGAGVPRALVQAFGPAQQSVLTGADGRFELVDLPEGGYNFQTQKPGFFNPNDIGGATFRGLIVQDGMAELQLSLLPEAAIDGHVADDEGEPLENVTVQWLTSQVQGGRRRWTPSGFVTTDESGAYHIGGLRPGVYAIHAIGDQSTPPRLTGQAYSMVFGGAYYPGTPTLEQAEPVKLTPGQQAQVDFSMTRHPGYYVSGVVTNPPNAFSVSLLPSGNEVGQMGAQTRRDGFFRTTPVLPGAYQLSAQSHDPQFDGYAELPVMVSDRDVTGVRITLEPAFNVPIQMTLTQTRSHSSSQQGAINSGGTVNDGSLTSLVPLVNNLGSASLLPLQPISGRPSSVNLHEVRSADDALSLNGVRPGRYQFTYGINPPYYLESARCGDTDLLESPLVVIPGSPPPPIHLSFRDDSAALELRSVEDGKTRLGDILLISSHSESKEFRNVQELQFAVAPGTYKIYSFDNIADLEYMNPDVMREYASGGKEVTVAANATATVSAEVIHRAAQ